MWRWSLGLLGVFLVGCPWVGPEQAASLRDRDGDGDESLTFGGGDCDDDDPDVSSLSDADQDGVDSCSDCDDADGSVALRFGIYPDGDSDGYGSGAPLRLDCLAGVGEAGRSGDCDDRDAAVFPTAPEVCDQIDNDCDQQIDADDPSFAVVWWRDADEDGFGDPAQAYAGCEPPSDYILAGADADCDDTNAAIHPGAEERCTPFDDDCDGLREADDPGLVPDFEVFEDGDGDGYGAGPALPAWCSVVPLGSSNRSDDCDDLNPLVFPKAQERCNNLDDDCDLLVDVDDPDLLTDEKTWYVDDDGDGFGGEIVVIACFPSGLGVVQSSGDCDDDDPLISPVAEEVCDDLDNDCDELSDADDPGYLGPAQWWYPDVDHDGLGEDNLGVFACAAPSKDWIGVGGDCKGDGPTDWILDVDGDGWGNPDPPQLSVFFSDGLLWTGEYPVSGCAAPVPVTWLDGGLPLEFFWVPAADEDCEDGTLADVLDSANGFAGIPPAEINPIHADTWYDGVDQNCDGADDYDQDGDGVAINALEPDCDDTDPHVSPLQPEIWYDGQDDNCDPSDDDDRDGDGALGIPIGDPEDCNDKDAVVYPGAVVDVPGDFSTVQAAVDRACDGMTIVLGLGPLDGAEVSALHGDDLVIRGGPGHSLLFPTDDAWLIVEDGQNVTLQDLEFGPGLGTVAGAPYLARVRDADSQVRVERVYAHDIEGAGSTLVVVGPGSKAVIEDSLFEDLQGANILAIVDDGSLEMVGNEVRGVWRASPDPFSRHAVRLNGCEDAYIADNLFVGAVFPTPSAGVLWSQACPTVFERNRVVGVGQATGTNPSELLQLGGGAIESDYVVRNNVFAATGGVAIRFKSGDLDVHNNTHHQGDVALDVDEGAVDFRNNALDGLNTGVLSTANAAVLVTYNNFNNVATSWIGGELDLSKNSANASTWVRPQPFHAPEDRLYQPLPSSLLRDYGDPATVFEDLNGSRNDIGFTGGPYADAWDGDGDGDGLPDWYEVLEGLPPGTSNVAIDSDDDGFDDIEEFFGGTLPLVPDTDGDGWDDGDDDAPLNAGDH